jgi:hypothetical protein
MNTYLLKRGTATYWNTSVGNAIDTIIEPVQVQRDQRIREKVQLKALLARDKKRLRKQRESAERSDNHDT